MEVGKEIRRRREGMGLSQAALAERLLISQPTVARIELGMIQPTAAVVALAAEVFGCTTDALIYGEKQESA